jgi:polygalacturonase
VRDVKIINDSDFDDGMDVVGSKNILIDRCFIRTKDDCIAIKSGVNYFTSFNSQIKVENIRVKNTTVWNGTYGNGLEIGFETRADTIKDVVFENIDIIHNQNPGHTYESAITIHDGDRAVIDNILYKNIRIEDPEYSLIDFRILQSEYSQDAERGKISNIRLEDITVTSGGTLQSSIRGFSDTKNIKNIQIKNMRINGVKILYSSDMNLSSVYLSNLTFE